MSVNVSDMLDKVADNLDSHVTTSTGSGFRDIAFAGGELAVEFKNHRVPVTLNPEDTLTLWGYFGPDIISAKVTIKVLDTSTEESIAERIIWFVRGLHDFPQDEE